MPPHPTTAEGKTRRVGVEIEFGGLEPGPAAAVVAGLFGGAPVRRTEYVHEVRASSLGDFVVEVDSRLLKRLGEERESEGEEADFLDRLPGELLAALSLPLTPVEVVSPPVPLDRLAELERLVEGLRSAGASGTKGSLFHAFGVHFNVEPASLAPPAILAHLRALAVLEDWLREETDVDFSRRLSGFLQPWPERYVRRLLEPDYAPDRDALIDDYLADNATRNRAFDLLPLFAHLDEARVRAAMDDPLLKARPTYHYRLANSRLGDPAWTLAEEWERWVVTERLAADAERLASIGRRFARRLAEGSRAGWSDEVRQWLRP